MDKKYVYKYRIEDDECFTEFTSKWKYDEENTRWIAEEAGDYDYYNCDGMHHKWPKIIFLYDLKGNFLGKFKVDVEYMADFMAREIK